MSCKQEGCEIELCKPFSVEFWCRSGDSRLSLVIGHSKLRKEGASFPPHTVTVQVSFLHRPTHRVWIRDAAATTSRSRPTTALPMSPCIRTSTLCDGRCGGPDDRHVRSPSTDSRRHEHHDAYIQASNPWSSTSQTGYQ